MQSNVAICIIILSSIAFVILAWTFFARRRREFKQALLVTHNANQHQHQHQHQHHRRSQTPLQLQTGELIPDPDPRPSGPRQSSSALTDDTVLGFRKAKKDRDQARQDRMDKTREMTGGQRHAEKPTVTARSEDRTGEHSSSKDHRGPEPEGSGQCATVDPVGGSWGDTANTTQKDSQGGWGEENANTGAAAASSSSSPAW